MSSKPVQMNTYSVHASQISSSVLMMNSSPPDAKISSSVLIVWHISERRSLKKSPRLGIMSGAVYHGSTDTELKTEITVCQYASWRCHHN